MSVCFPLLILRCFLLSLALTCAAKKLARSRMEEQERQPAKRRRGREKDVVVVEVISAREDAMRSPKYRILNGLLSLQEANGKMSF